MARLVRRPGFQDGPLANPGPVPLGRGSVLGRQGHEADALKLLAKIASGVVDAAPAHLDEKKSQPAEQVVGLDRFFVAVVHRPQLRSGLHVPPAPLQLEQLLVAQGDLLGTELGVRAPQQELAPEMGVSGHPARSTRRRPLLVTRSSR